MNKIKITIFIIIAIIPILACGTLTIFNDEYESASVKVTMPGELSYISVIGPHTEKTYISFAGGKFTVQVLPSEVFIRQMRLYEGVIIDLMNSGAFDDYENAFETLEAIEKVIEEELDNSAECEGKLKERDLEASLKFIGPKKNDPIDEYEKKIMISRWNDKWTCSPMN